VLIVATWYASENQASLQAAKEEANFERLESELSRTITTEQFNEWREQLNEQNNTIKVPRLPDRRAAVDIKQSEEN